MDAMPSQTLKPANEEEALDETRLYRTTYMFSATMPPAVGGPLACPAMHSHPSTATLLTLFHCRRTASLPWVGRAHKRARHPPATCAPCARHRAASLSGVSVRLYEVHSDASLGLKEYGCATSPPPIEFVTNPSSLQTPGIYYAHPLSPPRMQAAKVLESTVVHFSACYGVWCTLSLARAAKPLGEHAPMAGWGMLLQFPSDPHRESSGPAACAQVERLARKYLRRPVVVNIGTAGRATDNVTQRVQMVKENEKPTRLEQVGVGLHVCTPVCMVQGLLLALGLC